MDESTPQDLGGKIAPAVAMLLLGDSAAGGALAYRRHKNRNK